MKKLSDIRVAIRLPLVVLAALLGLLGVAYAGWSTVDEVKVGGALQRDIAAQNEMLADILPPPGYLVEAHLEVQTALIALAGEDSAALDGVADRMGSYAAAFRERHELWQAADIDAVAKALMADAYATGLDYLDRLEDGFLPALEAGDLAATTDAGRTLAAAYATHRAAIVAAADASVAIAAADTQAGIDLAASRQRSLVLIVVAVTALVGLAAVVVTRSVVKPLLEVLAGIPTIVYGFFALVTVGPFLRDISAAMAGGAPFIQAQSVLTAGLVMGIMLIPFVSSLSDDIITAVPGAMRDGSLGLGATRSETIKRVILPAALPGIVGALLLTASRAIGETMIVVLAAGVAANLTANPFEAMTTITVKIVNQLTGDLEFTSPQTLVAFALGMTLFVLTLGMNVFALYIVRKYREQYE